MTLQQASKAIGRVVIYLPARRLTGRVESGVITSVNEDFVFVRYGINGTSAATRPEDLELERGEVRP